MLYLRCNSNLKFILMFSTEIKPQFIAHGAPGKCNDKMYVVEVFMSSYLLERHVFLNKRSYQRFICHLDDLFPSGVSCVHYPGLSFDYYELAYNKCGYDSLFISD